MAALLRIPWMVLKRGGITLLLFTLAISLGGLLLIELLHQGLRDTVERASVEFALRGSTRAALHTLAAILSQMWMVPLLLTAWCVPVRQVISQGLADPRVMIRCTLPAFITISTTLYFALSRLLVASFPLALVVLSYSWLVVPEVAPHSALHLFFKGVMALLGIVFLLEAGPLLAALLISAASSSAGLVALEISRTRVGGTHLLILLVACATLIGAHQALLQLLPTAGAWLEAVVAILVGWYFATMMMAELFNHTASDSREP